MAGHFDKVDRVKFKEILGDKMCFWGNVPVSLLCTGTPRQVKDDVGELVELFGGTGTLILDSGLGIPDEARPETSTRCAKRPRMRRLRLGARRLPSSDVRHACARCGRVGADRRGRGAVEHPVAGEAKLPGHQLEVARAMPRSTRCRSARRSTAKRALPLP